MRILFLINTVDWLDGAAHYNGGGWASSLIALVREAGHSVGVAFQSTRVPQSSAPILSDGMRCYPIPTPEPSLIGKFRLYHGGYRREDNRELLPALRAAVQDFRPDVVHLFGLENPLSVLVGETDVPVLVHLQGILGACIDAYFPPEVPARAFLRPFSAEEWIYRNGFRYGYRNMRVRAALEQARFARARFVTGRTEWDRGMTQRYAPGARYFRVSEVLRPAFYEAFPPREANPDGTFRLVSTLSETPYKGIDLVLKTAALLKEAGTRFRWSVIGVPPDAFITRVIERATGVRAAGLPIDFMGCMGVDQMIPLLGASDLYIHPSYIDNSPNSLCEAQMAGLPVVATRVGGVPSLVRDGESGLLVPPGDAAQLADAILRLSGDAMLRERLARAGAAEAAARHDRETILRELTAVWETIRTAV